MCVHTPTHVSVHVSPHMSTHMPSHVSVHVSPHISTHMPSHVSVHVSPHMSTHMPTHVSAHMSPRTCLHTHQSTTTQVTLIESSSDPSVAQCAAACRTYANQQQLPGCCYSFQGMAATATCPIACPPYVYYRSNTRLAHVWRLPSRFICLIHV